MYWYFQSPSYWTQIAEEKEGTGQPNVNGVKLANIRVPVPGLDEQQRIVHWLSALQAQVYDLCRLQVDTAAALDALLPSVLDRALSGAL